MLRKNVLLGLLVPVLLVATAACGGGGEESASDAPSEESSASTGAEPDVEGIPEVVAEVNGEDISRAEFLATYEPQFQQSVAQSQASGQEVDQDQLKEQVVENLVSTELLVQEAERRDFTATPRAVDQTLEELAEQNGLESVDAFVKALEEQGLDREGIETQVRTQVLVDQLVEDEAGSIEPSTQEIRALYDQLVAQQEQAGAEAQQQVPPLKQVRPQLEQQLVSQEQAEVAETLVTGLRKDADVVVNL